MRKSTLGMGVISSVLGFFLANCGTAFAQTDKPETEAKTVEKRESGADVNPQGKPVYVIFMMHLEGDEGPEASNPTSRAYQTRGLPDPEWDFPTLKSMPSFEGDIRGLEIARELCQQFTDSFGNHPKLWVGPTAEVWQTEADAQYGGKLFRKYEYISNDGYEFGLQAHPLIHAGKGEEDKFLWRPNPHTAEGIKQKLVDLHQVAESVVHNGKKINTGRTLTPGYKAEAVVFGPTANAPFSLAESERMHDLAAYELGYRVTLDDWENMVQSRPGDAPPEGPVPWVYEADFGDGVKMVKLGVRAMVLPADELIPRRKMYGDKPPDFSETIEEGSQRFDATVAMRQKDSSQHVYYYGFAEHPTHFYYEIERGKLIGRSKPAGDSLTNGEPFGNCAGFLGIMRHIQKRVNEGATVKFVTPWELAQIYYTAQTH